MTGNNLLDINMASQLTIWRPWDVPRTSCFGQYDVRIWRHIYLILWTIFSILGTSDSDVSLDVRGTSNGHQAWHNIPLNDVTRTSRECQPTMSKFGQTLTFPRQLWRPQGVLGTSENHILVRIRNVHLWPESDIQKTLLTSSRYQNTCLTSTNWSRDVRSKSRSLVRI